MARTGKDAVFGDGVLWRTGWRAGYEGVPSQDAALVFQGVLPGVADRAGRPAGGWYVPVGAMNYITNRNYGDDLVSIAHNIFKLLREADKFDADVILIEAVDTEGLGLAIMNRLIRTCEYNYIR